MTMYGQKRNDYVIESSFSFHNARTITYRDDFHETSKQRAENNALGFAIICNVASTR